MTGISPDLNISSNSQITMTQSDYDTAINTLSTQWGLDRSLTIERLNKTLDTNNITLTIEPSNASGDTSNVQQNLPTHLMAMLVMLAALMEDKEIFQKSMLASQQQVLDAAKTQKELAMSGANKMLAGAIIAGGMAIGQGAVTVVANIGTFAALSRVSFEKQGSEATSGTNATTPADNTAQANLDIQEITQVSQAVTAGAGMLGTQGAGSMVQGSFTAASEKDRAESQMRGAESETLRSSRDLSKASLDSAKQMMDQVINVIAQMAKSNAQTQQSIIQNI